MTPNRWDSLLVTEHEMIERAMDILKGELEKLPDSSFDIFTIRRSVDFLLTLGDQIHNKKEEDVLFPLMVKRGIPESGPIHVMLLEHEAERTLLNQLLTDAPTLEKETEDLKTLFKERGLEYLEIRANHIWKENDILYNLGRQVFTDQDNQFLVEKFEQLNISIYGDTSSQHFAQQLEEIEKGGKARKSLIHNLSMEQIDAIMETLPIEVTFVDASDTVTYFNRLDKDKIFVRTRSDVGRKVQKCHPEKSVFKVQQIVNGFRDGSMDKAEFWINFEEDIIHIRYFPVRNEEGNYLGIIEVTQRIAEIQRLTGEKRLLD